MFFIFLEIIDYLRSEENRLYGTMKCLLIMNHILLTYKYTPEYPYLSNTYALTQIKSV